jgi:hypothetical protein
MGFRFTLALVLAVSAFSLDASAQGRGIGANRYSGITVYEHPDYRGDSFTFRNEITDLRQHGLNDRISSIEVSGNQAWEVCQDINFGGACRTFTGTIDDLRELGWNDRISSMRAAGYARNGNRGGGWGNARGGRNARESRLVFYERPNFRGDSRDVMSSSSNLGSAGNRARSVEVYGGTWELCDGYDRNAGCVTITDSVSDLRSLGLRNGVESVREVGSARNNRWWQ